MARFKVVSVDMFQTLVDANSGHYNFWQEVLGEEYTEVKAEEYTASWVEVFSKNVNNAYKRENGFVSLKKISEECFDEVFQRLDIAFDPVRAAQIHIDLHKTAPAYEDTERFLKAAGQNRPVCLVSDADEEMIQTQLSKYQFDQVFISERLKSYKNDPDSKVFQAVLDHYKTRPEEIIHIGDGYADVNGAHQAGIITCWLNRDGTAWDYELKPDFVVGSLTEAAELIV
ncbi:MAG: HAD family hydrolase [Candidatus Adiutricales bacterium]